MPGKKIHLIRAAQARPFIETALRLGVPVRELARRADLPYASARKGEGVIGEHALWRFVELASGYPGCEYLGYLCAADHPVTPSGRLGGMAIPLERSLREILHTFFREVVTESDSCDYRLRLRDGETWFTRELVITEAVDGWQPELYVLSFIIQIARLCAPGDWLPGRIRVATRKSPQSVPVEWSPVRIEWGCSRTELRLEEEILDLPPRFADLEDRIISPAAGTDRRAMWIQDLVDRQIWSGQCGLENAARELGMSAATLKRRLADMNSSYSKILARRRIHHGLRLLTRSNRSIREIAGVLGYSSASNFSRAFRQATGASPIAWRKGGKRPPPS